MFCPEEGRTSSFHSADPREEGMESKPNPFSEISKQTSQAGRAPHAAWPAQHPAPGTREVFTKYLKRAMKAESESEKKNI